MRIALIIILVLIGSGVAYLLVDKKQSSFEKEFWLERSYEVAEKCDGECGMCKYEWCGFRK